MFTKDLLENDYEDWISVDRQSQYPFFFRDNGETGHMVSYRIFTMDRDKPLSYHAPVKLDDCSRKVGNDYDKHSTYFKVSSGVDGWEVINLKVRDVHRWLDNGNKNIGGNQEGVHPAIWGGDEKGVYLCIETDRSNVWASDARVHYPEHDEKVHEVVVDVYFAEEDKAY
ncbi:MAG: hypothetical protein ACYSUK_00290 [Planctomycetota bacterium]